MTKSIVVGRYRDVFAVAEFRAIFASHVLSVTGTVVAELALAVLVFSQTGSPLLSALVFSAGFVPHLIGATMLSALVDRTPVRRLMVTCNLFAAALAVVVATSGSSWGVLLALAVCFGLVGTVFAGTRAANLPQVVPDRAYVPARSLMRLVGLTAMVSGFAGGGVLLGAFSPRATLLIDATCFVASAVVLRLGTAQRPPRMRSDSPLLRDSLAGLATVLRLRSLRPVLLLGWGAPMLAVVPEALAVPYAHEMRMGAVGAGLFWSAQLLGTAVGELLGTWLLSSSRQVRGVGVMTALVFTPLLLFALRPGLVGAAVIMFVSGLGIASHLGLDRLFLDVVPGEIQGRALSIQTSGLMFWQGFGYAIGGGAAQLFPLPLVMSASGVLGLILVVIFEVYKIKLNRGLVGHFAGMRSTPKADSAAASDSRKADRQRE